MKDYLSGWGMFLTVLAMLVIAALVLTAVNGYSLPWFLSIERTAVENSRGFIHPMNEQALSKIEAWYDLEVDKREADESTAKAITGQQRALYDNVCQLAINQLKGNVTQPVRDFLGENGDCRF